MRTQKLTNKQPSPLGGVGLILLILLVALAGSAFFNRLTPWLGGWATVGFIAFGAAMAWFLLNWYGMSYIYTANADCLRVCRAYGKRERLVTDVWLNRVMGIGEPEAMKARFPGARVIRATRAQCPFPPLALAYRDSEATRLIILQPDEAMAAHLKAAVKR